MSNSLHTAAFSRLIEHLEAMPFERGKELRIFMSESQKKIMRERLFELKSLISGNTVSQKILVDRFFNGMKESSSRVQLSSFISAIEKLSQDAGFLFSLQTDRTHGKDLGEKVCTLTITGMETMLIESSLGNDEKTILDRQEQEAVPLKAVPDTQYRIFVSVTEQELNVAKDLIRRMAPYLKGKEIEYEFGFIDSHEDGDTYDLKVQASIAKCHFGLLLLSQQYFSSVKIMSKEYPNFYAVEGCLAPSKKGLPVMLSEYTLDGLLSESGKQIRNNEGLAYVSLRSDVDKNLFAESLAKVLMVSMSNCLFQRKSNQSQLAFAPILAGQNHGNGNGNDSLNYELIATKAMVSEFGKNTHSAFAETESALSEIEVDVLQYLQAWVTSKPHTPYLALLGEYGMGKTWACLNFVQEQLKAHKLNPQLPTAIYLDLRRYSASGVSRDAAPMLSEIIETAWIRQIDISHQHGSIANMVIELVRDKGAIVVFDGLDEVANHLTPLKRNAFFAQLVSILPANHLSDKEISYKKPGKILISCRSNLFASLSEEANLFLKQQRGGQDASNYEVLRMLPFNEQQIREYIDRNLPGHDIDKVMELLNQVHNLRELAERPYNLSVLRHQIGRLESQRNAGQAILPVKLYQNLVEEWLERDEGKHIISKDHKPKIMMALAAYMTREGTRQLAHSEVTEWLDDWLEKSPAPIKNACSAITRDELQADLRTATFIVRPDSDQFQFAHTSLMEYFLAEYLIQALEKNTLKHWEMPLVSNETFGFMVQLLDLLNSDHRRLAKVQTNFLALLECYTPKATELAFKFWLITQEEARYFPRPIRIDCSGANLHKWRFLGSERRPLNLNNVDFSGAQLGFSCWHHVQLDNSLFKGSQLPSAEFISCNAANTNWESADLRYSQWRHVELQEANFLDADMLGARVGFCEYEPKIKQDTKNSTTTLWYMEDALFNEYPQEKMRLHIALGHTHAISSVACSEDKLLTGSFDTTAKVWDLTTAAVLLTLVGHLSLVTSVSFSSDGCKILTGSADATAKLWDAVTGELLFTFEGHSGSVTSVAFSPDGSHVLTGSTDFTAKLWNTATGALLRTLVGHEWGIKCVAYSPDGCNVLTGSSDGIAMLWEATTGRLRHRLLCGDYKEVSCVAFTGDGQKLLTGSDTARLWDANKGVLLLTLEGHLGRITSAAFSPVEGKLLTGSKDKTVKLWDVNTGSVLLTLPMKYGVNAVTFSPNGRHMIASDLSISIWDTDTNSGNPLFITPEADLLPMLDVTYSPDGSNLLSVSKFESLLWNASSGALLPGFWGDRFPQFEMGGKAFSPDGRYLLAGRLSILWDISRNELHFDLSAHKAEIKCGAFSSNGKYLLTGSNDSRACVWSVSTGDLLYSLICSRPAAVVAFSPDGSQFLTGSSEKTELWDTASGALLHTLDGESGSAVFRTVYSPDGRLLATSSEKVVRIWDTTSGTLQRSRNNPGVIMSIVYSPVNSRLLIGLDNGTAVLWDTVSGAQVLNLVGHIGKVSVAFSPDGSQILTGATDKTAKIWNAETGELLHILKGHFVSIVSVAYSPDGNHVATGSADNTIKQWDARTGEEVMTIYKLPREHVGTGDVEYVTTAENNIISASAGAWRYAYYKIEVQGVPTDTLLIPAEAVNPLPGCE